jgi:hypothetical protein
MMQNAFIAMYFPQIIRPKTGELSFFDRKRFSDDIVKKSIITHLWAATGRVARDSGYLHPHPSLRRHLTIDSAACLSPLTFCTSGGIRSLQLTKRRHLTDLTDFKHSARCRGPRKSRFSVRLCSGAFYDGLGLLYRLQLYCDHQNIHRQKLSLQLREFPE